MTFLLKLILFPLIASLIGWITNYIAVWLLFNPKNPVTILGLTFQGVFPKRQNAIAQRIGDLVADELLSVESLKNKVFTPKNREEITHFAQNKLSEYLQTEFKKEYPLFYLFLTEKRAEKINQKVKEKIGTVFSDLSTNFHTYLEEKVNIRELVSQRIRELDSDEVNQLMNAILKSELRFIEWTGAILGFLIGLFQVLLLHFVD